MIRMFSMRLIVSQWTKAVFWFCFIFSILVSFPYTPMPFKLAELDLSCDISVFGKLHSRTSIVRRIISADD